MPTLQTSDRTPAVTTLLRGIGPIGTATLANRIVSRVRDLIVAGALPTDTWLRLADLAEAVGTSITPARSALWTLEHEGLVEVVKARGFRIVQLTREDLRDAYLINAFLSGELAARAAAGADEGLVRACSDLHAAMERVACEQSGEDIDELNWAFHRAIHRAAGSPRLVRHLRVSVRSVPHAFHHLVPGATEIAVAQHRALLDAIRSRDADLARTLAAQHVEFGYGMVERRLEETGYWLDRTPGGTS